MIQLKGSFQFDAPREAVWDAMLDPDVLLKILPGCEQMEAIGDHQFHGKINLRIGPVHGKFDGDVKLSELDKPNSYHLKLEGKGAAGFINGEGDVKLEEVAERAATMLHYSGTAHPGGRIAGVGQRLLDSTTKSLVRQGLTSLHQRIKTGQRLEAGEQFEPETLVPPAGEVARQVAKDVISDLVPPHRRPWVIAGSVTAVVIIIILIWALVG